jgi:superfamily II DNA or RNA helicase
MTLTLRDYQQQLKSDIYAAWQAGARNVLGVLPCGGGKTAIFSNIIAEHTCATVAIAHRSELVSQMSVALARNGVRHRVIGPSTLVKNVVQCHMMTVGVSYYDANARCAVASVQTLVGRDPNDAWFRNVGLWVCDEVHHLVRENSWGKAVEMFPNARGLGVTATPIRADNKGLGRHADGVIDTMVSGPDMRWLIDGKYLSGYRIFAPPNNLHLETVPVTAGGDYSPELLRAEVHRSSIHGDVVDHYLRVTPGKLGVTFAVDIESATELAAAYRSVGVPAEVLTGKTPANIRYKLLAMFARGDVKQLCTCDLISEGFDLPSVEVCSMARPTQSYGLFVQQFGRAIRPLEGKTTAYILDHVGNVLRHGLPDAPRVWSLDRRERRRSGQGDATVPIRICPQCTGAYERFRDACPYCSHRPEPVGRSTPEQVIGDLAELTPEVLARLRGQIAHSEELRIPYNAPPEVEGALRKRHRERLAAQAALRDDMALYGGAQTAAGLTLSEAQRKFYLEFGVDVAHAQMLNATDATALMERMRI